MAESETNENPQETTETVAPPDAVRAPTKTPAQPSSAGHGGGPQDVLAPKERRRRARAAKAAQAKPRGPRSAEERHQERVAERAKKAEIRRSGRARAQAKAKASRGASAPTPPRERTPGVQKVRQGVVISDRAEKTITVRIDTARRHRRYAKIVRTSRTVHAHDERGEAHIGDTVVVREARPLSRTKRWRLIEVVQRAR